MQIYRFFATCPVFLEELLKNEAENLGASDISISHGGISFNGTIESAYKICLWSRIANRLLLPVLSFEVNSTDDIKEATENYEWEKQFNILASLSVDATLSKNRICTADYAALCVKDGLVSRAMAKTGSRPSVDRKNPDVRLHIHLDKKNAEISIDLSGEGLHKRGYRIDTVKAAVRENTAAALLLRSGWVGQPVSSDSIREFIDPMCGSGTILIEAAMISADIAPALNRKAFGFEKWKNHDKSIWEKIKLDAIERAAKGISELENFAKEKNLSYLFEGRDIDPMSVIATRNNINSSPIARLYKSGLIKIIAKDFFKTDITPKDNSSNIDKFIVFNPPYGERLKKDEDMIGFYSKIGLKLKESFSESKVCILAGSKELSDALNLKADKINTIYNGGIRCTLSLFTIYKNIIKTEALQEIKKGYPQFEDLSQGSQMLYNRLKKNAKKLKKWLNNNNIECYRLYDADMPEYSLALDIYPPEAIVQEYAPPKTIDRVAASKRFSEALFAIQAWLKLPEENIKIKTRKRQSGYNQYNKNTGDNFTQKSRRIIKENGLKFFIDTNSYLDTGIFLDSRPIRALIKKEADKKHFLNLFCYTGTASVYAAAGGALSTTSVDTSETYLDWLKMNLKINGYENGDHSFVKDDCLKWLTSAIGSWDLIFLDPPTFSNSKGRDYDFDIQKDHDQLITLTLSRLNPGGKLIFCNNFRRFKMSQNIIDKFKVEEITSETLDPDFSRKTIHRCWIITK